MKNRGPPASNTRAGSDLGNSWSFPNFLSELPSNPRLGRRFHGSKPHAKEGASRPVPTAAFCLIMFGTFTRRCHTKEFLPKFVGIRDLPKLTRTRRHGMQLALQTGRKQREGHWSEGLTVGNRTFPEGLEARLGLAARYTPSRRDPVRASRPTGKRVESMS